MSPEDVASNQIRNLPLTVEAGIFSGSQEDGLAHTDCERLSAERETVLAQEDIPLGTEKRLHVNGHSMAYVDEEHCGCSARCCCCMGIRPAGFL